MANTYNIEITGTNQTIRVAETSNKEITIDGKTYVVATGVVSFIEGLVKEVYEQQRRRVSTDKEIDRKIDQRVDRILYALSGRGMLAQPLNAEYPLPKGVETGSGLPWTFLQEAREVAHEGMKKNALEDLTDAIGNPLKG